MSVKLVVLPRRRRAFLLGRLLDGVLQLDRIFTRGNRRVRRAGDRPKHEAFEAIDDSRPAQPASHRSGGIIWAVIGGRRRAAGLDRDKPGARQATLHVLSDRRHRLRRAAGHRHGSDAESPGAPTTACTRSMRGPVPHAPRHEATGRRPVLLLVRLVRHVDLQHGEAVDRPITSATADVTSERPTTRAQNWVRRAVRRRTTASRRLRRSAIPFAARTCFGCRVGPPAEPVFWAVSD